MPADLGPALDAVAVTGPAAPAELDLDLGPEPGPSAPDLRPAPAPEERPTPTWPALRGPELPDPAVPEAMVPEAVAPEVRASDRELPDPVVPEGQASDRALPDPVVPERVAPDRELPDLVIPERVAPEPELPGRAAPDGALPDPVIPEGVAPEPLEAAGPAGGEPVGEAWPGRVGDVPEGVAAGPGPVARRGAAPDSRQRVPGAPRPAGDEGRAPVALTVGAADPVAWWGAGRRQPVIATETTATIPVHLLFRDDAPVAAPAGPGGAAPATAREHGPVNGSGTAPGNGGALRNGDRRPPVPRSPRAHAPTRPAPLADPRIAERPGPVVPGWAALTAVAAGAAAGLAVLGWQGALPAAVTGRLGLGVRPYDGIGAVAWALLALLAVVVLFICCGLGRGRAGHASVLTLFGDYRGSVRRTGLLWISPLLRRRRIDVRLRHWRSEPLSAVDAGGTALRVEVLVVWRVKDTARATLGVADHECYLRDQVEAALARVLSQLPADAFQEDTHTLRDAEAVGDALTGMLKADCVPVGIEVYSAQPTGIEYAPEIAAAMQRRRVAAIDARHRDGVLTSVVDAVDDTVGRLTARGIVELDAYEHKALVRDLTVAFYTGRSGGDKG
ncbi:SPFH domain-containing protein [Streptomyces sp. NPDC006296]|uniref:SPFH domain-containing protein n=1 Tax=Streptomyces sp. NPDC006296 TaxID=3156746 RepID=UPI0033A6392F